MTTQLFVKMTLDAWHSRVKEADKIIDALSDEQLMNEVAPGRNRGIYLLGHLTAVHDMMLPLLDMGPQQFNNLNEAFIDNPDKAIAQLPSAAELRQAWKTANATLADNFSKMQPDDWFQRHTAVTDEKFATEPHRNKLNIIISRTSHLSYHAGQLALLKK